MLLKYGTHQELSRKIIEIIVRELIGIYTLHYSSYYYGWDFLDFAKKRNFGVPSGYPRVLGGSYWDKIALQKLF